MEKLEDILKQTIKDTTDELHDDEFLTTIVQMMPTTLEAMSRAYTLGRNNTADWIANHCIMKEYDECGVHYTTHEGAILRAKTTEDLNLKP